MYHVERKHIKTVLVLLSVVLLCGVGTFLIVSPYSPFTGLQNDLKEIEPPEEASYTDLNGAPVKLSTFKGKPLIINSWATWMPFSKDELNHLGELKDTYGDAIQILAINRMEDAERIKSYIEIFGLKENIIFLIDPTDNFYKAIQGYAMPESVFYNKDGTINTHKRGVITVDEIRAATESILKE